jgi:hypothetical protein
VAGARGRLVRPELLDEALDRDDPVRLKQQDGQERTLLGLADRDGARVDEDLERPQEPVLGTCRRAARASKLARCRVGEQGRG